MLGKLLAGMLSVVVVVVAALPLLVIIALLGGVSTGQILRVQAVTLASALAAGQLGLDDRAVARKNVSSPGDDRAGVGAVAGGLGNRRGRRRWVRSVAWHFRRDRGRWP